MQDPVGPWTGFSPGYAWYISPVLFNLNLLQVQEKIVHKILLITFKALNEQTHHISDLINFYIPRHNISSSFCKQLVASTYNLRSYAAPARGSQLHLIMYIFTTLEFPAQKL